MKHYQLNNILDELTPALFSFSFAVVGERSLAKDLIVDAYTVYAVKEKRFILKTKLEKDDLLGRRSIKKYLYKELLREILELATKRSLEIKLHSNTKDEFTSFYNLDILKRGVLFLKEVKNFSIEEVQEVFVLERHRAIEVYYNARFEMIQDIESLYREVGRPHA